MSGDKVRYVTPDALPGTLRSLSSCTRTTQGRFTLLTDYSLEDMEWNHMDHLHRPTMHRTYNTVARLALGKDFALSLTRWGKWPFFLQISDVRIRPGLYYQVMIIAGFIYLHNVIHMEEENDRMRLTVEWNIASHWLFKPLHGVLSRKLYRLNERLQREDTPIRDRRKKLRTCGYSFRSSPVDYLSSNRLTNNTVYPPLAADAHILLSGLAPEPKSFTAGTLEFIARWEGEEIHVWPRACPHEGADLMEGTLEKNCQFTCLWHGLKFSPARLSAVQKSVSLYGFDFRLEEDRVSISALPQV